MASPRDFEASILGIVSRMFADWLAAVRRAVFGAGRLYPDPSAVQGAAPDWADLIDSRLLPALEQVAAAGWEDQSGQGYISANGFVLAQLALTRNLLVRIPDEVYNRIFEEITIGQTNGETQAQIADRIDAALFWTGSEYWPFRARTIAATETHRAWMGGILAAAQYYESATGPGWRKVWRSEKDPDVRPCHRLAEGQVRPLRDTFLVCGEDLMYPGDPVGSAANVVRCRCDLDILEAS